MPFNSVLPYISLGVLFRVLFQCTRLHIGLAVINEDTVERFLKHLPLCHCAHRCQRQRHIVCAAVRILLALLHTEGRIAPNKPSDTAAIIEEISRFERLHETGVRPTLVNVQRSYTTRSCFPSPAICRWSYKDRCRQTSCFCSSSSANSSSTCASSFSLKRSARDP